MDTSQARALPGVHAVITGMRAAELCDPMPDFGPDPARHTWRCLAADKVRYVGEGVAVAVADSRYLAEDALELIEVEYEPLPAVVDPEQALAAGAPLVHEALESNCAYERSFDFGEVERDFAEADAVVTDEGHDYHGPDEIRAWLARSASEYTYTIELTAAARADDQHFDAVHHLEGNFPGGVVDLHFRFTLRGALISRLVIEP